MAFKITWEKHGVILHCSETVTMLDLIDANCKISGQVECDELQYIILDFKKLRI